MVAPRVSRMLDVQGETVLILNHGARLETRCTAAGGHCLMTMADSMKMMMKMRMMLEENHDHGETMKGRHNGAGANPTGVTGTGTAGKVRNTCLLLHGRRRSKIFLPDYLVGFLLLHRSGLDAHERANILVAIRGEFSVASVEKALKEQWTEDDLQRRDRIKHTANVATDHMDDDDDAALNSFEEVPDEHYEPEAFAAYMEEQGVIDSALEAIKEKRRTLKEARWRQSQVKKSRQFYSTNRSSSSSFRRDGPPRDVRASVEKCLKCGGPHSTHMCPVKKQQAHVSEESAEIVFSAMEEGLATDATTGHEALQSSDLTARLSSGKGIIDCGATSTLGSIAAVESIMANNLKRMGRDRVTVDPDTQPTFRFGNNGTTNCLSTVKLGVDMGEKSGSLEIHVHDVPDQPVLISVKALKKLGAILDFGRNEVVYRKVCDKSVVPLEVAGNGHLLMPLNGNPFGGSPQAADFLAVAQLRIGTALLWEHGQKGPGEQHLRDL